MSISNNYILCNDGSLAVRAEDPTIMLTFQLNQLLNAFDLGVLVLLVSEGNRISNKANISVAKFLWFYSLQESTSIPHQKQIGEQ